MKKTIKILGLNMIGICLMQSINAQDYNIPFNGNEIHIIGIMQSLHIIGTSESEITISGVDDINEFKVNYKIDGNRLKVPLESESSRVVIRIPSHLNVTIHPLPIAYEGGKYERGNYPNLKISKVNGEIEVNADGLNVDLERVGGPVSVVTYGDISSILSQSSSNKLISLDTYMGNITIGIPNKQAVNLDCTAIKGLIEVDPKIKRSESKKAPKVILHSEHGEFIKVKAI